MDSRDTSLVPIGRPRRRDQQGSILLVVSILMVVFAGMMGLAVDTSLVMTVGQELQDSADTAALAAVRFLPGEVDGDPANPFTLTRQAAVDAAGANDAAGEPILLDPNTANEADGDIVVGIWDGAARSFTPDRVAPNAVRVRSRRTNTSDSGPVALRFGGVFSLTSSQVSRMATALAESSGGGSGSLESGAVVLLDSGGKAFHASGNGKVTIGGPVQVNSSDKKALFVTGNATVEAAAFDIVGGVKTSGNATVIGPVTTGVSPVSDPLASIPEPDPAAYAIQASSSTSISGNNTATLYPGVYQGGISISGNAVVTMVSGIYLMDGGGFSISGNADVDAPEVMVFNTNVGGGGPGAFSCTGNGTVDWTPPASGTYAGLALFQDRTSSSTVKLTGNGNMELPGTLYARDAHFQVTGNGVGDILGGALVAKSMKVAGNGQFTIGGGSVSSSSETSIYLVE